MNCGVAEEHVELRMETSGDDIADEKHDERIDVDKLWGSCCCCGGGGARRVAHGDGRRRYRGGPARQVQRLWRRWRQCQECDGEHLSNLVFQDCLAVRFISWTLSWSCSTRRTVAFTTRSATLTVKIGAGGRSWQHRTCASRIRWRARSMTRRTFVWSGASLPTNGFEVRAHALTTGLRSHGCGGRIDIGTLGVGLVNCDCACLPLKQRSTGRRAGAQHGFMFMFEGQNQNPKTESSTRGPS